MNDWQEIALGDLCEVTIGRQRSPKHAAGANMIPYIRAANVKDARIDLSSVLTMNFTPEEQRRYGLKRGDVLITEGCGSASELGASATWRRDLDGIVGFQNHVLRLRAKCAQSDPRFLGPLARWLHRSGRWVEVASGTSILNIGLGRAQRLRVRAPCLRTQAMIGEIFETLDILIENSQRRIEVLEEMAQATYREWFVHFRYPGHDDATFVDSALGPIPEGWDVTTLRDAGKWLSGGTPRTNVPDYWSGDIPWITSGTLTSMLLDRSERMLTPLGAANGTRIVPRDTLLFVVRGMSLVREFRVGIADRELAFGQDCKALVANPGIAPLYLALAVISMAGDIQKMSELAGHGTGKLSTDRLQAIEIPKPPEAVQQCFVDVISPMRDSMTAIRLATDQLVAKRNLLLPKLVTGEIDVSHLDLDVLMGAPS